MPKWEPDWISTVFELESSAINEEVGDILKTYDVSKLSLIFNVIPQRFRTHLVLTI